MFLGKTMPYKLLISAMLSAYSLMFAVENNNIVIIIKKLIF